MPNKKQEDAPTYVMVKDLFSYDPETGVLTWRVSRKGTVKDREAGSLGPRGYRGVMINYKNYLYHRIIWVYMTKEWPKNCVDHINLNKKDNRWINLREATYSQNQHNRGINKNNTSGFKGVSWHKASSKYQACIFNNSKKISLGSFLTKEEAGEAYEIAAKKYHGDFARIN